MARGGHACATQVKAGEKRAAKMAALPGNQAGDPMPLVPMTHLLDEAQHGGYAVCYCEAWNLESLQAVVEAAEEADSPVITGFNGGFLRHSERSRPENLAYYAGMALAFRETSVPVSFLLNETDDFSQIEQGIRMGFNAVMVENEHLGKEAYRELVRRTVERAHGAGASVEAALGRLPDASGGTRGHPELTDPAAARYFTLDTGIDALGVSVGNVHILTKGKVAIALDALRRIHDAVQVPLVLHGGTGIAPEHIPRSVRLGVAKVNFGTVLKQVYLAAIQEKLAQYHEPLSPHPFVGMGGTQDILTAGREAVKQKARELMAQCGSVGKAGFLTESFTRRGGETSD
jgi:ketose-bisphosphate aldolase